MTCICLNRRLIVHEAITAAAQSSVAVRDHVIARFFNGVYNGYNVYYRIMDCVTRVYCISRYPAIL